jgi:tetratricopeptide (TPR) repeat protein
VNRLNQTLVVIIAAQLLVGGYLWFCKQNSAVAPVPGFAVVDPLTATDLKELAADCSTAEQWRALANIYMSAGFFAEADSCYAQSVKLQPDFADAIYEHGFCLSRFGKTARGNQKFAEVIALKHERSASAAYLTGRNHLRDEQPDLAEAFFRQAARLPMAKFELARLLFRKNELDEAESLLVEILTDQPNASRAKLLISEIASAKNKPTRSTSFSLEGSDQTERIPSPFTQEKDRLMQSVAKYGPEKVLAQYMNLFYEKKYNEARPGLERVQEVEWTPHVHDALVKIAIASGDLQKAENLIEQEIAHSGPTTQWLGTLGEVRMKHGDAEGAIEAWTAGVQVRNDSTINKCYLGLGQYYDRTNDEANATKYQVLLMLDLAQKAIVANKGGGQGGQAVQFAKQAVAIAPESAEAHYVLGKAFRSIFSTDEAIEAYEKCLAIDPTHGRALRELTIVQ